MVRPIFEAWLAPFKDLGATTITIRNTGGTDHLSFDAVGLPGFQFIQDPLDYGSRTHHSEPGRLRSRQAARPDAGGGDHGVVRLQRGDVRPEMLPRKPLAEAAAETPVAGARRT